MGGEEGRRGQRNENNVGLTGEKVWWEGCGGHRNDKNTWTGRRKRDVRGGEGHREQTDDNIELTGKRDQPKHCDVYRTIFIRSAGDQNNNRKRGNFKIAINKVN